MRLALCFGWIDSIVKRLDDGRYLRKLTPRTNKARWSRLNIERAIGLIRSGQMTEAGYAVLPHRSIEALQKLKTPERVRSGLPPAFILKRLKQEPRTMAFFKSLAPSHRRNYMAWIMSAKQETTRRRRLEKAMDKLRKNELLGLV